MGTLEALVKDGDHLEWVKCLIECFDELIACLSSRFLIDDHNNRSFRFIIDLEFYLFGIVILAVVGCFLLYCTLLFPEGFECFCLEVWAVLAVYLSGLEDEFTEWSKITGFGHPITRPMLDPMTPYTDISFHSDTKPLTDRARGGGIIATLPPLMEKFLSPFPVLLFILLGGNILTFRFPQLEVPADFVDHDATFFALEDIIGEPGAD